MHKKSKAKIAETGEHPHCEVWSRIIPNAELNFQLDSAHAFIKFLKTIHKEFW